MPDRGFQTYRVMENTFLDDGQTRRYRFYVAVIDRGETAAVQQAWTEHFEAVASAPLQALATLGTWQATGAMGLHGGPLDGPSDAPLGGLDGDRIPEFVGGGDGVGGDDPTRRRHRDAVGGEQLADFLWAGVAGGDHLVDDVVGARTVDVRRHVVG